MTLFIAAHQRLMARDFSAPNVASLFCVLLQYKQWSSIEKKRETKNKDLDLSHGRKEQKSVDYPWHITAPFSPPPPPPPFDSPLFPRAASRR
jgi:hypothetical protein